MKLIHCSLTVLALAVPSIIAQNLTDIVGTWSSGAQAVVTGAGFANPENMTFSPPKTTGVSYSFSDDMYYEIARYRFTANASNPACITGVLQWVHGNYTLLNNGSITMVPFPDGFQQIQDPCAAQSNFIDPGYNYTELYQSWQIFQDPVTGLKLHLFEWDGTPVAPQFLVSASPNMLPTTSLRKKPAAPATTSDGLISGGGNSTKRDLGYQRRWTWTWGL